MFGKALIHCNSLMWSIQCEIAVGNMNFRGLWWHPISNQCWYVNYGFVMNPNLPQQAGPDAQRPPTGTCMWRTPSRTAAGTTGNVADPSSHSCHCCYCWPLPSCYQIGELSTAKMNFEPQVEGLQLGWLCQVPMLAFGRIPLEHRADCKFGHTSTAKCCKADSEGFKDVWQEKLGIMAGYFKLV